MTIALPVRTARIRGCVTSTAVDAPRQLGCAASLPSRGDRSIGCSGCSSPAHRVHWRGRGRKGRTARRLRCMETSSGGVGAADRRVKALPDRDADVMGTDVMGLHPTKELARAVPGVHAEDGARELATRSWLSNCALRCCRRRLWRAARGRPSRSQRTSMETTLRCVLTRTARTPGRPPSCSARL